MAPRASRRARTSSLSGSSRSRDRSPETRASLGRGRRGCRSSRGRAGNRRSRRARAQRVALSGGTTAYWPGRRAAPSPRGGRGTTGRRPARFGRDRVLGQGVAEGLLQVGGQAFERGGAAPDLGQFVGLGLGAGQLLGGRPPLLWQEERGRGGGGSPRGGRGSGRRRPSARGPTSRPSTGCPWRA